LATLPEYRGYGIGSALIKKGLEEGMEKGLLDFWLGSSNDGHALYEKFGFRDVESVVIDLAQYGGEGLASIRAMRRVSN
jgi:ribosomal protein S18 acetylase RimI-like enzyme